MDTQRGEVQSASGLRTRTALPDVPLRQVPKSTGTEDPLLPPCPVSLHLAADLHTLMSSVTNQ